MVRVERGKDPYNKPWNYLSYRPEVKFVLFSPFHSVQNCSNKLSWKQNDVG